MTRFMSLEHILLVEFDGLNIKIDIKFEDLICSRFNDKPVRLVQSDKERSSEMLNQIIMKNPNFYMVQFRKNPKKKEQKDEHVLVLALYI